jgi:hypothetical protein
MSLPSGRVGADGGQRPADGLLEGSGVVALTLTEVRESRNPASRRLDGPGVAASALGLVGITLGLVEASSHAWGSWPVLGPLATGAVFLACFALWERHARHPMIPSALLGARGFVSASAVFVSSLAAFSSLLYYVTLLNQDVNGWSALRTGLSWPRSRSRLGRGSRLPPG